MKRITSLLLMAVMLFGLFSSAAPAFASGGAENYPLNSIVIKIEDAVTHRMLGGARFEIYFNNSAVSGGLGTLVATVDSDSSGVIVISGLPSGYYIVRQTMPPNNYQLSISNDQHAFIKPDGTSIVELVFSNYRYGGLLITLNDKNTGLGVGGATFSVTDVEGKAVGNHADGVYTTDARGQFYLENLPAGDYRVTQLTAAQGYAMDNVPNVRTVRLQHTNADQSVFKVQFANSPLGTLLVNLRDSVSKEPLSGAVFNVRMSGGADMGNFTTGANGSFSLPRIARGTYIISQVSAPTGYLLATSTKSQYVDYVNTFAVDFENQPRSGLVVTKHDRDTRAALPGARFNVFRGSTLLGSYTTNADGLFHIPNLDPGWYTVVETQAPPGYILDETPQSVQVTAETLHRLEFMNSRLASLQIIKTDEFNGEPLAGARFRITTQNGEFVADVTTDASGRANIPSIAPGWYVITETRAPVGYLITEPARTVEVRATVPTVVTITNRAENSLQILKLDFFTRAPLAGATFRVQHANGENVGTFITDSAGKVLVGNLREGAYVVSEVRPPDGYQLDSIPQTVVIQGGKIHSVEFLNKPMSGIQILKLDAVTKNPLSGATFVVERANGERIGTFRTDSAGKIIVPDLESGTYIVSETIAPEGYIISEAPKTVVVTSGRLATVEFENAPLSGIQILKTGMDGKTPLIGAVFTIERVNGERVGRYTTDVAGKIIVHGLTPGVYIVSEIQAPVGFLLNSPPQTVEVRSGRLTIVEFTNRELPNLYIRKTDAATGELLSGAEFIVEKNGVFIAYVVSSNTGAVVVPRVQPGIYTITEVKAPAGYELNDPVRIVEVTATGDVFHNSVTLTGNTVTFGNNRLNSLQIVKLDSVTHNPLSGAIFSVDRVNGERIGTFRTDSSGTVLINELAEGTYIISEIAAPNGYQLDETPKTISISGGRLVSETFFNKPLSGIQITKLDAVTRQPLQGATFSVTRSNGENIGTFRTGADGMVLIPNLAEGSYIVSETAAPNGYQLDETPKTVNVVTGRLATVEFMNRPHSGIQILLTDAATQNPLANGTFNVARSNGERIGIYRTDTAGKILIPDLSEGSYIVSQTAAPNGYILDQTPKTVTVVSGRVAEVAFTNAPYGSLVIRKTDEITGRPLAGAVFTVQHQGGASVGEFTTGNDGSIAVPNLRPGWYVVSETRAPQGYHLDSTARTIEVRSHAPTTITFTNRAFSGIQIVKLDSTNRAPLAGATFTVTRANGERIGTFRTEADGKVLVPNLDEGIYVVGEIAAPDGYILNAEPQNVTVRSGQLATVEFLNKPLSGIQIIKLDATNRAPLAGATFRVARANGEVIGTFRTEADGKVLVPNLGEGVYVVGEIAAPDGFILDAEPQNVTVRSGQLATVEFLNKPLSGIQIIKLDATNRAPLAGATFRITRANGEVIGTFRTEADGKVIIPGLNEGVYVVGEIAAPDGYILDAEPQNVTARSGQLATVEFLNKPLSGIVIQKLDSVSRAPLPGATFVLERDNGERIGTYRTDTAGKIIISDLTEGTYIVSETAAPDGYILDAAPQTVIVRSGRLTEVEFVNKPMAGLQIIKIDSNTRQPIAGVMFSVSKMNGERIGEFTTRNDGTIFLPELEQGWYTVTETRAASGYILDSQPRNVEVKWGQPAKLTVENTAMSGLLIVKTDEATRQPLAGVVFEVRRADGQVVTGLMSDGNQPNTQANSPNRNAAGGFITDANGRIQINTLPPGEYHVVEQQALDGYELDTTVHTVTVTPGRLTTLNVTNRQKAGLRLLKIDSVTKQPIFGVEFMVFDSNNRNVGTYITDNNGLIDFTGILTEGRYTIRETRAADGYYRDDMPRTVEFRSGRITEVVWENTPQMGQIQILKLSGDDNEVNGLPKGTPLAGAVFEVYHHRTGNLVDRFVSGSDGRAVSKPLPLGRYTVKEVQAPQWYRLSTESLDIEIEFATQIIRREFLNYSANTGVTIRKTGNNEAMSGDLIRYDIRQVRNDSTVPLTDFYWRDVLPTEAVRLERIVTGTYNQSLRYKIIATTNKGDTRVIADNLSTTVNNVIDTRPAALGLRSDEFITSFTLVFGTVRAGFTQVEIPQVFVRVQPNLPNGQQFGNRVDVGGKYGSEWVIGSANWVTTIYAKPNQLPRTGF